MTIDEAIKHCEEVVEKNEQAKKDCNLWIDTEYEDCCADHRQLAEWLRELKEAKRLLKLAVEDLRYLESHTVDEDGSCLISERGEKILCSDCPFNNGGTVNV